MLTMNELPEKVQKEIERIAKALEILNQTAVNRTSYKKGHDEGLTIYKPITQKVKPSYSISYCKDGKWVMQVNRYKNIDEFRDLMTDIIGEFEPDFVRVATYNNDSRNSRKAGEVIYTLVLNEGVEQPPLPEKEELKIISMNDPEVHNQDLDKQDAFRTIQMLLEQNEKTRQAAELGKIEAVKSDMSYQYQLLQKESDHKLFKIEVNNELRHLREMHERTVAERDKLRKELEEAETENEELFELLQEQERKVQALTQAVQQKESADAKMTRMFSFGGLLAGNALKHYAGKNPGVQKALDGLMQDIEKGLLGMDEEDEVSQPKEGTATIEQPQTEEDQIREGLHEWLNSIQQKSALQVLSVLAEKLSTGKITLQEVYDLCKSKE